MSTPEAKFKSRIKRKLDAIRNANRGPSGLSTLYYTFAGGSAFGGATGVDLSGIVCGRPFAVEIKRPDKKGKLTTRQELTLAEVSYAGGFSMVVDSEASLDGFIDWVLSHGL